MAETSIAKTYKEIGAFDSAARHWLAQREARWRQEEGNKNKTFPGTKFTYAVNRVLKRSQDALSEYQEKINEIAIRHAAVDDKGVLDVDERGQFRFKPDELIKRNSEQNAIFRTKTEIEPYYATVVPDDLTDEEKLIFEDFVIRPEAAEPV